MINISLLLAYDGTRFLGWQKTKEGPSIEGALQSILEQILQEPVVVQAASRTDAGVHAQGQIVNFTSSKTGLNLDRFCRSLNCLLPKDMVVLHAKQMPLEFHPTLDCQEKEYHYWTCNGPAQLPIHRFYSWHYPYFLDIPEMRKAAQLLIGVHDFHAFCNNLKNKEYDHYIREITSLEIQRQQENRLQFAIKGPNFLYKMIRNIVGTLVYIGAGKIKAEMIPKILSCCDRTQAGMTAPAHGLTLYKVFYTQ